jgi:hypothetical protein
MKQKFTSEKNKYLVNKNENETMFNFKISCLMKKQFNYLMMVLAMVILAGTSAMAQDGLSVATAVWHLPGSTHGLSVADGHTNTAFSWAVESIDCAEAAASETLPAFTGGSEATASATFTYPEDAAGIYRFTVTENTTGDGACSTTRQFFTAIMNIDVVVLASDNTGAEIAGLALSSCNDYTLLNGSDLVGNENTDDNTNSLGTWQEGTLYNERWVDVTLTVSDNTGCIPDEAPANAPVATDFAWQFDYTVAGTNFITPDNFIGMQAASNIDGTGNVTYTDGTSATSVITVEKGVTGFTIPLRSYIRWGTTDVDADQAFTFTVDAGTTALDDDATLDYTDGTEPSTANGNNSSASQNIDASPATPRITIND